MSDAARADRGAADLGDGDERASLSVEGIALAAERIVDHEGLAALTMRRLGRELGVEAMSIYYHVPNKAALRTALVTRLLTPSAPPAGGEGPLEIVEHYVRSIHAAIAAHPNRAPLVADRLPTELFDDPLPQAILRTLVAAGFDHDAAAWILDAFVGYAVGHALVELSDGRATNGDDHAAFDTGLRFLLVGLRDELGL